MKQPLNIIFFKKRGGGGGGGCERLSSVCVVNLSILQMLLSVCERMCVSHHLDELRQVILQLSIGDLLKYLHR